MVARCRSAEQTCPGNDVCFLCAVCGLSGVAFAGAAARPFGDTVCVHLADCLAPQFVCNATRGVEALAPAPLERRSRTATQVPLEDLVAIPPGVGAAAALVRGELVGYGRRFRFWWGWHVQRQHAIHCARCWERSGARLLFASSTCVGGQRHRLQGAHLGDLGVHCGRAARVVAAEGNTRTRRRCGGQHPHPLQQQVAFAVAGPSAFAAAAARVGGHMCSAAPFRPRVVETAQGKAVLARTHGRVRGGGGG